MKKILLLILFLFLILHLKAQDTSSYYYSVNKLDSSDSKPEFIDGIKGFANYIIQNQESVSSYEPEYENGSVQTFTVLCIVEKDGNLSHIRITKSDCADCDSEILRLLKLSPKWKPGTHNGISTKMKILLNIKLHVEVKVRGDIVLIMSDADFKKIIYTATDIEPTFPDGINKFYSLVKSKIKHQPQFDNIFGRVAVSFVVERNGKLKHVIGLRSPDPILMQEMVQVIRRSPRWKPGTINGVVVRTQYTVLIPFQNNEL